MKSPRSWLARATRLGADAVSKPPSEPQPPVTLQVRQGADGTQVVVLWVTREVADREGLALQAVPHRPERPMFLDVDTDIMGAAVVPLQSFQVRLLEDR